MESKNINVCIRKTVERAKKPPLKLNCEHKNNAITFRMFQNAICLTSPLLCKEVVPYSVNVLPRTHFSKRIIY